MTPVAAVSFVPSQAGCRSCRLSWIRILSWQGDSRATWETKLESQHPTHSRSLLGGPIAPLSARLIISPVPSTPTPPTSRPSCSSSLSSASSIFFVFYCIPLKVPSITHRTNVSGTAGRPAVAWGELPPAPCRFSLERSLSLLAPQPQPCPLQPRGHGGSLV
jgi:hypothetical protein